jgi:hypothetical protein
VHLQVLLEHTLPEAELLCKWRMPCYYLGKRPICYLNRSKDYVDVGIWHATHLSKQWDRYLVVENRKVVKSLRYKSLDDINNTVFIAILKEIEAVKEPGFNKRRS